MPRSIVFDVNETLLDLSALNPHFEYMFGDASAKGEWFSQMLQSAMVMTIVGEYQDFATIGDMALEMVALRRGVQLQQEDFQAIRDQMVNLPPHPEVGEALQRLRDAEVHVAALTNSTLEVAHVQLTNAGLISLFDGGLHTVEKTRRYKPALSVYNMTRGALGQTADNMRLVAAHDWDVIGALKAGWFAAFIARPGKVFSPGAIRQPDIFARDLMEAVDQILERDMTTPAPPAPEPEQPQE